MVARYPRFQNPEGSADDRKVWRYDADLDVSSLVNGTSLLVDARDYGTDGAAIQSALTASKDVWVAEAVWPVTSTVTLGHNQRLSGTPATRTMPSGAAPGGSFTVGSCLQWAGATNGTILSLFDAQKATVEGISVDGNNISGVLGINFDADNNPYADMAAVRDFSITRCGTGMTVGQSAVNDYQADKMFATRGTIRLCDIGIAIRSINSGYSSVFENLHVTQNGIGFDIEDAGNLTIRNVVFGGHETPRSTFTADIYMRGVSNPLLIENCQTEDRTALNQWFLHVPDVTTNIDQRGPITLIGNRINDCGVLVEQTRRLVLIGNSFFNCNVVIKPATGFVSVLDLDTRFAGDGIRTVADGATTNTSTTLTSATAAFVAGDAGKRVTGLGIPRGTTIASVTNSTTVELDQAATATATGVSVTFDYGFVVRRGQVISMAPTVNYVAPMSTLNSTTDGEVLRVESDTADPRNTGIGLRNRGVGGNTWVLESSGPSGRSGTGGFGIYNSTTAALAVRIDSAAMANSLRLTSTGVTFGGVVKSASGATGSRPSAATVGAGSMWYDTTLTKPIWSDGSVWKDATGTTV